ncbi:MAG: hypothetical protein HY928_02780, partial [Elusimicrobia bacterium]|nr:hypothetical protein [Elusimicrobiota bacterium]
MENEEEKKAGAQGEVPARPAEEKDDRPWMQAEEEPRQEVAAPEEAGKAEELGMAEAMALYDTDKSDAPSGRGGGGGGRRPGGGA